MRALLFASLLALAGCKHSEPRSSPISKKLTTPEHLSEKVKVHLKDLMVSHGADMNDLLWSVLFLDYKSAADIGANLSDSPLVRAAGDEPTEQKAAKAGLPPRFLELQRELKENALDVTEAAQYEDPEQLSDAFSRLSATCVRCHAVYLETPPEQTPDEPGDAAD